ncbi:MAG: acetate--CoA ligase family protein [Sphingopyxis sp.]|nr:acetate--CoA ligase family protein [Sphingopyxis sp.]
MSRRPVYSHAQMKRLVAPETVAVIGLSRNEKSFGARAAANLAGFAGRTYGVNPGGGTVHGVECFPSIGAIPVSVDSAVLAVPADAVADVVEQCAIAGVGGCVIFASGFAETGREDRIALQERIVAIGRAANMRIVGPNCFGLINNVSRAGLSFSGRYAASPGMAGPVGLVSQSGGLAQALAQVTERGGSYSHFLAAGNSADVDVCDYISYLAGDETCRVIACIAEGLADGERLLEAGEAAMAGCKPIIMYKIATGSAGAKAAMSHTGTLAGSNAAYDAAYARAGIVKADNIEDVYPIAAFFAKAGCPKAGGVAAVAASGGACVITLDKSEAAGVAMPLPGAATKKILEAYIPDYGAPTNPCDITAGVAADGAAYAACVEALLNDPAYSALVVMAPSISEAMTPRNVAMFSPLAAKAGKPVCLSWMSEWRDGPGALEAEADPNIALFKSTEQCFGTLRAWHDWAADPPPMRPRGGREGRARTLLDAAGAKLTEREGKAILAAYGVPVATDHVVASAEAAVAAAKAIGYPVVLKVESPDIAHKTEAGVVRLDLTGVDAVRTAYNDVIDAADRLDPKPQIKGVLVQPMIASGVELVVGAQNDPTFGPMVIVGLGGIMVELIRDSAAELAPVTREQAAAMLRRLKGYPLLTGFRGSAPVNIAAIEAIIVAVSELAADHAADIAEIDVNPIICGPGRAIAVDALIVRK